jgi:2-polyprenyl-3-methyl-5-hydroxy-6-metoxy-1,4-benzoquinol methylase
MKPPALGKPAEEGQEILHRRRRLCLAAVNLAGKSVLDYGCGNGAQTLAFAGDAARIMGVDVQADNIETFRRAAASGSALHVTPVLYGGGRLPANDAAFDVVISFDVLEHVGNESQALQEIRRVLTPGGDLLMTVPNKWWIFETHGARLPVLPWNRVPFLSWLPAPLHRRFANARIYRRDGIEQLLREAGLTVVRTQYMTAPLDVLPEGVVRRMLRRTLFRGDTTSVPFLATAIFVHARKV